MECSRCLSAEQTFWTAGLDPNVLDPNVHVVECTKHAHRCCALVDHLLELSTSFAGTLSTRILSGEWSNCIESSLYLRLGEME